MLSHWYYLRSHSLPILSSNTWLQTVLRVSRLVRQCVHQETTDWVPPHSPHTNKQTNNGLRIPVFRYEVSTLISRTVLQNNQQQKMHQEFRLSRHTWTEWYLIYLVKQTRSFYSGQQTNMHDCVLSIIWNSGYRSVGQLPTDVFWNSSWKPMVRESELIRYGVILLHLAWSHDNQLILR